ncbi:putative endonuclease [Crenobacter luteus]|uniref:YraN family protein n=1 Tax=Crenobacter luteus TaxID=1452487 RepID=UPI0010DAC854|nr:YraN family protein [Crenobacter luteus]TCP12987.1 putative endonuclease [Crenobacter luteus]
MRANARGRPYEDAALALLTRAGLTLCARNWHCRGGEIDLVMRDGATWVFVEVRQRRSAAFGGALESINESKCRKLRHAAAVFLMDHGIDAPCRIDAVLFEGDAPPEWLKNIVA